MIRVGLTGGIGSGKSLVSKMFSKLGIPVYDSDSATKTLYKTDVVLKQELIKVFGKQTYLNTGELNRNYIGQLVFGNKSLLNKLNKIVHPRVKKDFEKWIMQNEWSPYIIKEAAILIESGAYKQVNSIIVVSAPLDIRINRVIDRDKMNREEVLQRINSQMDENELIKHADFVINNGLNKALLPQVLSIHQKLVTFT